MLRQFSIRIFIFLNLFFFSSIKAFSQTEAIVKVDTTRVVLKPGLSFPYWLNAGQTIKKEAVIKSISVIEFNLDSLGNLRFVKPMSITSNDEITVPDGKVWKMEAIGLRETLEYGKEGVTSQTTKDFSTSAKPSIFTSPATFVNPGTYKWTVPPDVSRICVEVWGAGGKGGDIVLTGGHPNPGNRIELKSGSGGGGGYGYQCFDVKPNTQYEVKVGYASEETYVGSLIVAHPGSNGGDAIVNDTFSLDGDNGKGGKTTAYFNINGQDGSYYTGGNGANNGGQGGVNYYNYGNYSIGYYDSNNVYHNYSYVGEIAMPNKAAEPTGGRWCKSVF